MLTIDTLQESDIPAARRLSAQAGWKQLDADWRRLLSLWPQSCFAGRDDWALVATSTSQRMTSHSAWVGMVLVDEAHRGQGHGGALLDAALLAATKSGIQAVGLDATDLGRPVYLKRGFRDVAGIDRWVLTPDRWTPPAHAASRQSGVEPLRAKFEEAMQFDRSATGISRRALLARLVDEAGAESLVLRPSGRTTAFAIHRPGRSATHLGPVVADSESDAADILDRLPAHLTPAPISPILIDVPRGRLDQWLTARGLLPAARRLTRKLSGAVKPDLLAPQIFAACGFELG